MSLKYQTDEQVPGESDNQRLGQAQRIKAPFPIYTVIFVASILAVFAAQVAGGLEASINAAGFVKPAFVRGHEYWRILTGAATHGSVLHVGLNCFAFYNVGRIFEMLSNRGHLSLVFVFSAIAGNLLSLLFMPDGISVGASGGIVGLIGFLTVYSFRRKQFISPEFRRNLIFSIGYMLIVGIALYRIIDNFGHVGGLLMGAVYGLIQIPSDPHVDPREAGSTTELAGIAALGIYVAACVFSILLILRVI